MAGTPEYGVWAGMRSRCSDPKKNSYKNYGERGMTVCERWNSFENFFADMGLRPPGLTLERVKNELGYSPENCVWDTRRVQSHNTRRVKLDMLKAELIRARLSAGESLRIVAAEFGVTQTTVSAIKHAELWKVDELEIEKIEREERAFDAAWEQIEQLCIQLEEAL
jgi:hypothetical protein